jgi:hypothetical protein
VFADGGDVVLLVGPKLARGDAPLVDWFAGNRPVFFLNYTTDPAANPWPDPLTRLVRNLGGRVYTVSRPSEFASAWRDIRRRLAKLPARGQ